MSEPLLNAEQHRAVQKIASHFRCSQAKVRETVDRGALERGVLRFPDMADSSLSFDAVFSTAPGKFSLGSVLDYKKFKKSDLYQTWIIHVGRFILPPTIAYCITGCTGGGVLAIATYDRCVELEPNEAAIVLQYDYLNGQVITISSMQNWLQAKYPLPLS